MNENNFTCKDIVQLYDVKLHFQLGKLSILHALKLQRNFYFTQNWMDKTALGTTNKNRYVFFL